MKFLALAVFACAAVVVLADDYEVVLQKDRLVIQEQINKINSTAKKSLDAWPAKYMESLNGLETKLKKAGNLEGVLSVRKEVERFSQKKQITEESLVDTPEELRELQTQAMKETGEIELRRNVHCVVVVDEYVAALNELKTKLTKKGNVDQALVLHKEVERVKATAEYMASKLALDAAGVEASVPRIATESKSESVSKAASVPKKLLEGLVLYYKFDSAEKLSADSGPWGRHGSVHGATFAQKGKKNGAADFDGRSSHIRTPVIDNTKDITWAMWVFPRTLGRSGKTTQPAGLNGKAWVWNSDNTCMQFFLDGSGSTTISFNIQGEKESVWAAYKVADVTGRWVHLAVTTSPAGKFLYVDGKLAAKNSDATRFGSPCAMIIGANDNGPSRHFDGMIDEVMVFERALSEAEIKTLYNAK